MIARICRLLLSILLIQCLFSSHVFAEELDQPADITYTFSAESPVYSDRNSESRLIARLPLGTAVNVLDRDSDTTWVRISFEDVSNGRMATGYVDSNHLAKAFFRGDLNRDEEPEIVLAGETPAREEGDPPLAKMQILRKGSLLSQLVFPSPGDLDSGGVAIALIPGDGFTPPPPPIIKLSLDPQACDYGGGELLLLWDDGKLVETSVRSHRQFSAEQYHGDSALIFPKAPGGKPNKVLVKSTYSHWNRWLSRYIVHAREKTWYTWNGKMFIPESK